MRVASCFIFVCVCLLVGPAFGQELPEEPKEAPGFYQKNFIQRDWRLRVPARLGMLWSPHKNAILATAETGLQYEMYNRHVVSLLFCLGLGASDEHHDNDSPFPFTSGLVGGGVGYSYEMELQKDSVRLELGGVVGPYRLAYNEGDSKYLIMILTPRLHMGYRHLYLSLGPKAGFGSTVAVGFDIGLTFRF